MDGRLDEAASTAALAPYLTAIRRRFWLVAAIVLVTVGAAAGWLVKRTPTYQADAQILVAPLTDSDQAFVGLPIVRAAEADPARSVATAAALLDTPEADRLTAKRLSDGTTAAAVGASVAVLPSSDSNIVTIEADADSAEQAAQIANVYAEASLEARKRELRPKVAAAIATVERQLAALGGTASTASEDLKARLADLRAIRGGADPTLSVSLGAVTAVLIGLLTATLLTTERELLSIYELPVLARLPDMEASGGAPGEALAEIREGFRIVRGRLGIRPARLGRNGGEGRSAGTVVLITSPSRGDGRTTAVLNLARAVVTAGGSAVVIDMDLREPRIERLLGVEGARDLSALAGSRATAADVLAPVPGSPGLQAMIAPEGADLALVERLGERLPEVLAELRARFDCVLIDTPPLGEVGDSLSLLPFADEAVVAARLENTEAAALARMAELFHNVAFVPAGYVLTGGIAPDGLGPDQDARIRHAMEGATATAEV